MTRLNSLTRWLLTATVACAPALACEDRSPPDDVTRTRTGGIERVPQFASSDVFAGAGAAGTRGGPQAATGGASGSGFDGVGGIGGTGGASGIGDIDGDGTRDGLGTGGGGASGGGAGFGAAGFGGGAGFGGVGFGGVGGFGTTGIGGGAGLDGSGFGGIDVAGANGEPIASFILTPQCVSEIQSDVTLTSTASDPDGDALRCVWTMPSAVPDDSADCTVTVTFFNAAAAPVTLTVDDGHGGVHSVTADVAICGEPGSAP
jgi:hypothetical protein